MRPHIAVCRRLVSALLSQIVLRTTAAAWPRGVKRFGGHVSSCVCGSKIKVTVKPPDRVRMVRDAFRHPHNFDSGSARHICVTSVVKVSMQTPWQAVLREADAGEKLFGASSAWVHGGARIAC